MWTRAERCFDAYREALGREGLTLRARLIPDSGLLCSYLDGVIRLALPDPELPGGRLRATLLAGVLGIDVDTVVRLFGALLPRLVAHEIGHALRDEHGATGDDPWSEEQAADRLACLLSRPHLAAADLTFAITLLGGVVDRLGGLDEALAGHRHRALARRHPILSTLTASAPPPRTLYRDLATFLRITVAWTYLDLVLDPEDSLDDYRRQTLLVG